MRVRTAVTFAAGAATGAGVMYLLDPEAGEARRRELRRDAFRKAKEGAAVVVKGGAELTKELAQAAAQGYQQARADDDPSPPVT